MNKLALALVGLLLTTAAFANEYDRYTAVCRVTGTQQTVSTYKTKLPYEMQLKVNFATISGDNKTLKTTARLIAEKGADMRDVDAALRVAGTGVYHPECNARSEEINLGQIGAVEAQKILTQLGAQNVPDLARANNAGVVTFGTLKLGATCTYSEYYGRYYDERIQYGKPSLTVQVHFAPELWDGLSYHLTIDECKAIYIDASGDSHRLGH